MNKNPAAHPPAGGMKKQSTNRVLGIVLMIFGLIVVIFSITHLIVDHQMGAILEVGTVLDPSEDENDTILAGMCAGFASLVAGIILIITSVPRE
jgi:hypothetical protein